MGVVSSPHPACVHSMNQNPGPLNSRTNAGPRAGPGPKLLVELEPATQVFWRNLSDLVTARRTLPLATTCRPGALWSDVFVASRTPWWRFLESMLGHLVAVAIIMNVSQESTLREKLEQRRNFQHTSITYYRPAPSFPALGSNPGRARGRAKGQAASVQPATFRVAPKHTPRLVAPPDIKMSGPARPEIVASHPALPAMPLSAPGAAPGCGPPPAQPLEGSSRSPAVEHGRSFLTACERNAQRDGGRAGACRARRGARRDTQNLRPQHRPVGCSCAGAAATHAGTARGFRESAEDFGQRR